MTENEIRALLATCMAYDNRRQPGAANIAAWLEAAHRANWTFDAAVDAIHGHYAESPDFLMPGHITARLRAARQGPARYVALPRAEPASEEIRKQFRDAFRDAFRDVVPSDSFAVPGHAESRRGRPAPGTPEHAEAVARARAELDRLRPAQSGVES